MKITKSVLEKLFVTYNKEYFECFLILPTISTYIGQNSMGIFGVKKGSNFVHMSISIARNFKLTYEELRDLLLHEMIHQYVFLKTGKVSHNRLFIKKMKELNQQYGLDIRINSKHLFKKYAPKKSFWQKIMNYIFG